MITILPKTSARLHFKIMSKINSNASHQFFKILICFSSDFYDERKELKESFIARFIQMRFEIAIRYSLLG